MAEMLRSSKKKAAFIVHLDADIFEHSVVEMLHPSKKPIQAREDEPNGVDLEADILEHSVKKNDTLRRERLGLSSCHSARDMHTSSPYSNW